MSYHNDISLYTRSRQSSPGDWLQQLISYKHFLTLAVAKKKRLSIFLKFSARR